MVGLEQDPVLPIKKSDLVTLFDLAKSGVITEQDSVKFTSITSKYALAHKEEQDDASTDAYIAVDVVKLNIGDVKVTFLGSDGQPLKKGEIATKFRFKVEVDGLDPGRVAFVKFDDADYSCSDLFMVQLGIYPGMLEMPKKG